MAQQLINIGTVANDGTGDPLRSAFNKANENFTELYSNGGLSGSGTVTFIPKFDGTSSVGDSQLRDNGSNVVSQGVAAAAHDSYYSSVMQVGTISLGSPETATDNVLSGNLYYTGTPITWGRIVDGAGSFISLSNGMVAFSTLPTGLAGASGIVSERMRITNDGKVGIGTTTPSTELDISDGLISGTAYTTRTSIPSNDVDFRAAQVLTKTITSNTTFTFSNVKLGMVKDLIITGDYALTFPSGSKIIAGEYDGTVSNLIQIAATNTNEYWISISQEQV